MPCPRDGAALASIALGALEIQRCPTCRGVWGSKAALAALVGAPVVGRATGVGLDGDGDGPPCPRCQAPLVQEETRAPTTTILTCEACGRSWLDEEAVTTLRVARSRPAAPARAEPAPAPAPDASPFAPGPLRELAALAAVLGLAWLFSWALGESSLAFLVRMQFHELGHAVVAWTTGRSALPLPFGFTSWSLERSWLLVSMQLLFAVLLAIHGVRERKRVPIFVAVAIGSVVLVMLAVPLEASEPHLIAGGHVGEALLPALAMLAFHAPLPARARWDFWRWPLALVAAFALASVVTDDWHVAAGTRALPEGAFLSSDPGEGDLERLVRDHGWAREALPALFGRLATTAFVIGVLSHPLVLGARAIRARSGAG